jgi:hypothetical protein
VGFFLSVLETPCYPGKDSLLSAEQGVSSNHVELLVKFSLLEAGNDGNQGVWKK